MLIQAIKKRKDFLYLSETGEDMVTSSFVLKYALPKREFKETEKSKPDAAGIRVGYVVRKKIGNAVKRNLVRRRFKEAVKLSADKATAGLDYVIIARMAALTCSFKKLQNDLSGCFSKTKRKG